MKSFVPAFVGRIGGLIPTHGKAGRIEVGDSSVCLGPRGSVITEQALVLWHADGSVAFVLNLDGVDWLIDQLAKKRAELLAEVERIHTDSSKGFE